MKKFLLFFVLAPIGFVFAQNNTVTLKAKPFNAAGKKVIVYTTADSTSYRLSPTDTVTFKHMGQPLKHRYVYLLIRQKHSRRYWESAVH